MCFSAVCIFSYLPTQVDYCFVYHYVNHFPYQYEQCMFISMTSGMHMFQGSSCNIGTVIRVNMYNEGVLIR